MKVSNLVPLIRPVVRFEEVEHGIREVLASGQLTSGENVRQFEAEVAKAVGTAEAVSVTSATTALHLSLHALGVGPGDEVAVADFTFPATANAVIQTGAVPVMVDSGPASFAMCPRDLERRLSPRTKAVIPVDPFGQLADYGAIEERIDGRDIPIIADAACSLGSSKGGVAAGAYGTVGCFSFHPRKIITCGEGGMITTDDVELADRLRVLRSHGAVRDGGSMRFDFAGFNYRMSEIQAVLGRSQIGRLKEIIQDRKRTARSYDELFHSVDGIETRQPGPDEVWSYQSYVVVLDDAIDRDGVIRAMRELGIETTIGTYATHTHPAYAHLGYATGDRRNSHRYQEQALTLPLLPSMESALIDRVSSSLLDVVARCPRSTV